MPRRSRRGVFVAGFATAAFVAAGVAVAEGLNPFAGIGAADHQQQAQDILDRASSAMVRHFNAIAASQASRSGLPAISLLPETARLVGQLPSGRHFYVLSTTSNELCVLTSPPPGQSSESMASIGCGEPLNQQEPTTIETLDRIVNGPGATPPLTYGVARDDVVAVSFMAGDDEQTVPVKDNVWAYEGVNSALESLTVHYADGSRQTVAH